jgi:phosphate-selective porin
VEAGAVAGGELDNFTLGVNWHLTPYLRYTANWVHAITDRPATGEFATDFFAMRVGYEF